MRAGEVAERGGRARVRTAPAPTIRALAALVVLAVALLVVTGTVDVGAAGHTARPMPNPVEVLGERVSRTTTTSTPPAPAPALRSGVTASGPVAGSTTMSCAAALAYLASHQAPGFTDSCADGSAQGHLGYTCVDTPGRCEGQRFIRIACPAPFVYMNEAHNSWVLTGRRAGIDPYGPGTAAERAACARHR